MKAKPRSTFTFQIDADVRATLDKIAAGKEWTTGHLVNSVLTAYAATAGKPAKVSKPRKAAVKPVTVMQSAEEPVVDATPAKPGDFKF